MERELRKVGPIGGWVYVLTHPAWTKVGVVKIGMTARDPARRAAEITAVSGLIAPCTVHFCIRVPDRRVAEQNVHARLRRYRVRRRRELFRVSPQFATEVLRGVSDSRVWLVGKRYSRRASFLTRLALAFFR